MLHSITWQEFFWTFAVLVVTYYGAVIIILYNDKTRRLFNNRTPLSDEPIFGGANAVMGSIKPELDPRPIERNESTVESQEISVAAPDPNIDLREPQNNIKDDLLLLGTISDLLQQINIIFKFIAENKSTKEESAAFLRTLLTRYTNLRDSHYRNAIELYILNEVQDIENISLELPEIEQLWLQ